MNKLIPIIGRCFNCNYESLSWHSDLKNPICRKCGGLIKVIGEVQDGRD